MLRENQARQQQQQRRGLPSRIDETNELVAARKDMRECIEGCRARLRQQRLAQQHVVEHRANKKIESEETVELQEATQ